MFGYINVNKPELKIREFERYHSYYCGLCHSLKRQYGITSRFSLSYDTTFLVILLSSLYEPETEEIVTRCPAHPIKKHTELHNRYIDFGADMNLLCTWYTARDNSLDRDSLKETVKGEGLSLLYHSAFRKIKEKYPEKTARMEENLRVLHDLEKEQSSDIDRVCGLSGNIVKEIFVPEQDFWAEDLEQIGFHLGRFIYLCDAWEDIEKDEHNGSYNPLLSLYHEVSREQFDADCRDMMNMIMSDCAYHFEKLPLIEDAEILRNIIYSGVWTRYDCLLAARKSENPASRKTT